ncbi:hypothetical protein JHK85_023008 [Glycine max]|nr:hypothetical protein JHK85_023008 [Glycine max]KAG5026617.1 hypothetical protein JHK86_022531 [Glycine max]
MGEIYLELFSDNGQPIFCETELLNWLSLNLQYFNWWKEWFGVVFFGVVLDRLCCGAVLRDSNGKFIMVFSRRFGFCSVLQAKLWGIMEKDSFRSEEHSGIDLSGNTNAKHDISNNTQVPVKGLSIKLVNSVSKGSNAAKTKNKSMLPTSKASPISTPKISKPASTTPTKPVTPASSTRKGSSPSLTMRQITSIEDKSLIKKQVIG